MATNRAQLLRNLLLGAVLALGLTACSSGVVEYYDPTEIEPAEPREEMPSQDEFDGWADQMPEELEHGYCEDVTSYDNNWDNDMRCTRPDGSVFYTDYDGAAAYEARQ